MTTTWSGLVVLAAMLVGGRASAGEPAEEGRRHFLRGLAAIEMAKDDTDLALAADEFREAVAIDPGMAGGWFNLGAVEVKLGRYEDAITHYQRYLEVAPQAEDAARVRDELVKIEFRMERKKAAQARAGQWIGSDGTFYEVTVEGDRLSLHTSQRNVTVEDVHAIYTLVGAMPVSREVQDFKLTLRGDKLQGTWHRDPIKADRCTVPEEAGEVKGELQDRESRIVLRYTRSHYEAPTLLSILEDDHCGGVTVTGRREVVLTLRGPLPSAGLSGARLNAHDDELDPWRPPLEVTEVTEGSSAWAAGLREDDEILAINGAEVKDLSQGECLWRLRGKPGTVVALLVLHEGAKAPVAVAVTLEDGYRVPAP